MNFELLTHVNKSFKICYLFPQKNIFITNSCVCLSPIINVDSIQLLFHLSLWTNYLFILKIVRINLNLYSNQLLALSTIL